MAYLPMKAKFTNRHFLSAALFIFYLLPLLFFSSYSIGLMSSQKSWTLLSAGLLLVLFNTLILFFIFYYWEQSIRQKHDVLTAKISFFSENQPKVTSLEPALTFPPVHQEVIITQPVDEKIEDSLESNLNENPEEREQLIQIIENKEQELEKLRQENTALLEKAQRVVRDFSDYKLFSEEQLKQKHMQLSTTQQLIEDQRSEMEKGKIRFINWTRKFTT